MTNRTRKSLTYLLVFACATALGACNAEDDNFGTKTSSGTSGDVGNGNEGDAGPNGGNGCAGVDILFVIDNSNSMLEEQKNLTANFPEFVQILDDYHASGNAPLGYRVAVTTTAVNRSFTAVDPKWGILDAFVDDGDDGKMRGLECGLSQRWAEGPDVGVVDAFTCMANVGVNGTGWEMPLSAMELALGNQSRMGGVNEGFYRKDDNTLLAVVFITDEDDCSVAQGGRVKLQNITDGMARCVASKSQGMLSPGYIKVFLDDLTGGEGRYVVATIAGPEECQNLPTHTCDSEFGRAIWSSRLEELNDECGEYGVFGNIGTGDLGASLRDALGVMKDACDQFGPI